MFWREVGFWELLARGVFGPESRGKWTRNRPILAEAGVDIRIVDFLFCRLFFNEIALLVYLSNFTLLILDLVEMKQVVSVNKNKLD